MKSLWRAIRRLWVHPQQAAGEAILDDAGIHWTYDEVGRWCEFCHRGMAHVHPREVRISPFGERFVRLNFESYGTACAYCRYVDPCGGKSHRVGLDAYCEEHKFDAHAGEVER